MADAYIRAGEQTETDVIPTGIKAFCTYMEVKLRQFKQQDRFFDNCITHKEYLFGAKRVMSKIDIQTLTMVLNGKPEAATRLDNLLHIFFRDIRNGTCTLKTLPRIRCFERIGYLPGTGAIHHNVNIDGFACQLVFSYDADYLSTTLAIICEFQGEE